MCLGIVGSKDENKSKQVSWKADEKWRLLGHIRSSKAVIVDSKYIQAIASARLAEGIQVALAVVWMVVLTVEEENSGGAAKYTFGTRSFKFKGVSESGKTIILYVCDLSLLKNL